MTNVTYRDYRDQIFLAGEDLAGLAKATLSLGHRFRFCASGWSMSPFICDGDILTIGPLTDDIGLGEVVLFLKKLPAQEEQRVVVHRIVRWISPFEFIIRGDNVRGQTDGRVHRESVIGRVEKVERDGRSVSVGLGWERYPIAMSSRLGVLQALILLLRKTLSWRRSVQCEQ